MEQAFQTEMHFFNVRGRNALMHHRRAFVAGSDRARRVATVRNLSDFRPRPMHIRSNNVQPRANFTSGESGSVFLAPGDITRLTT